MKRTNHVASRLRGFSSGASLGGKVSRYRDKQNIYKQGTPAYTLFYIQEGGVRLTPALRPLYCPYAGAKHPCRGGPGRPALQLHRETPGLLARYGAQGHPQSVLPKVSQETLAEMIGTTRTRVNFFMNKFKKLGFVQYDGQIRVNNSLLSVVLHD